MKENKKYIDDLFKDKLGNHAETPPAAVWKALEKRLPGGLPFAKTRPSYKSLPWHSHFLIVSTAVTIGAGATYTIAHHINHHKKRAATHTSVNIAAINSSPDSLKNTIILNDTPSLINAGQTIIASNSSATLLNDTSSLNNAGQTKVASYLAAHNALQQNNKNITTTDKNVQSNNNDITAKEKQNATQEDINKKEMQGSNKAVAAGNNNNTLNSAVTNNTKTTSAKTAQKNKKNQRLRRSATHNDNNKENKSAAGEEHGNNGMVNDLNNATNKVTPLASNYSSSSNTPEKGIVSGSNSGNLDLAKGQLPGTFKDTAQDTHSPAAANSLQNEPATKTGTLKKPRKIELGIKAGYEGGVSNSAAQKVVVSPYIQYNLSSRLSLMLQPAIKFAHLSSQNLSGSQSFYKENSDSAARIYTTPLPQNNDTFVNVNVVYSQTHDSIVKYYTINGTYKEFELPVLLKYTLSKNIAVYGGLTLSYSTYMSIVERTYTSAPILRTDTVNAGVEEVPVNVVVKPVSTQITYSDNPISDYRSPLYSTRSGGLFKLGYMLGFSYTYSNRWLLDVLLQQSAAKTFVVGQYNTNATYSVPYFRITLGYRILK